MALQRANRIPTIDGKPVIEVRVESLHQLFDERDPAPFRTRDLDDDLVEYIVLYLGEVSSKKSPILMIHYEEEGVGLIHRDTVISAIHQHFLYEAELMDKRIKALLKHGFKALSIGMSFLMLASVTALFLRIEPKNLLAKFFEEGVHLLGWVSMWHPINIFLYDWQPLVEKKKKLKKLSEIEIQLVKSRLSKAG